MHERKFFQRFHVSSDRRSVQVGEPSEPGQGNRSGALDLSQETELRECDARGLEDRVVKRSRLSRGGPDRDAVANGLHSRVYTHVMCDAQAARSPRPSAARAWRQGNVGRPATSCRSPLSAFGLLAMTIGSGARRTRRTRYRCARAYPTGPTSPTTTPLSVTGRAPSLCALRLVRRGRSPRPPRSTSRLHLGASRTASRDQASASPARREAQRLEPRTERVDCGGQGLDPLLGYRRSACAEPPPRPWLRSGCRRGSSGRDDEALVTDLAERLRISPIFSSIVPASHSSRASSPSLQARRCLRLLMVTEL